MTRQLVVLEILLAGREMVEVWRIGLEDWEVILDVLKDGEERPGNSITVGNVR